VNSSLEPDFAVFPLYLPALRGVAGLEDKRLAPRSGVRRAIRKKPEWVNLIAMVEGYERCRVMYDHVRATNAAQAPEAFWMSVDQLEAVFQAMTSLFPGWAQDMEPETEVRQDGGAIIHLCQSIVDAQARIAIDRKYVAWHGFHSSGASSRSYALPGVADPPMQDVDPESSLQWWHVNRAKYAYRRSAEGHYSQCRLRRRRHAQSRGPCHEASLRERLARLLGYRVH
jgi:hypothetical protein